MVLVSVSIHEARVSSTFFGGLKASRRWKLKKYIILENIKSNELSLVFSKIVSKGLCCDEVWGISIFPSCTPIRGIYRKSLLILSLRYEEKSGFINSLILCLLLFLSLCRLILQNILLDVLKYWILFQVVKIRVQVGQIAFWFVLSLIAGLWT